MPGMPAMTPFMFTLEIAGVPVSESQTGQFASAGMAP
jgi:hypothetical protein